MVQQVEIQCAALKRIFELYSAVLLGKVYLHISANGDSKKYFFVNCWVLCDPDEQRKENTIHSQTKILCLNKKKIIIIWLIAINADHWLCLLYAQNKYLI